jgi:VIT1/CCC1 family predicted Fe2+/Mn2+ transporter
MPSQHPEDHRSMHSNWLRAGVLGANDGIISTASLIVGIAAADSSPDVILIAGIAGLVAGATSMAAGECVSVSSQLDTERADIDLEIQHLDADWEFEVRELTQIYVDRGLDSTLAGQVAVKLMESDALGAHVRDELGLHNGASARPLQAALTSAATFTVGAILPLAAVIVLPSLPVIPKVAIASLSCLTLLGAVAAHVGRAARLKAAIRVSFWGMLAMGLTAAIGMLVGAVV